MFKALREIISYRQFERSLRSVADCLKIPTDTLKGEVEGQLRHVQAVEAPTGLLERRLEQWESYFGDGEAVHILYTYLGSPTWFLEIDPDYFHVEDGLTIGVLRKAGVKPKSFLPELSRREAAHVMVSMETDNRPLIRFANSPLLIALYLFPDAYHQHFNYCNSLTVMRWAVRNEEVLLGTIPVYNGSRTVHVEGATLLRMVRDEHLPRGEFTGLNYVKEQLADNYTTSIANVRFSGSVDSEDNLPTDAVYGDAYLVADQDGSVFIWTGESWVNVGIAGGPDAYLDPLTEVDLPTFPIDFNHPKIRQLKVRSELIKEGKNMRHCVGSYTSNCLDGSYIFHVDDGSEDGATVEVQLPDETTYLIRQAEGVDRRKAPEAVSLIAGVLEEQGLIRAELDHTNPLHVTAEQIGLT